jgi:hypothetical protein
MLFIVSNGKPPERNEKRGRVRQYAVEADSIPDAIAKAKSHVEWDGVGKWFAKEMPGGVMLYNIHLSDIDFA